MTNISPAEKEALELAAKYVLAYVCHRIDKAENPGDAHTIQQSMAQAADDLIEDQIASFKRQNQVLNVEDYGQAYLAASIESSEILSPTCR